MKIFKRGLLIVVPTILFLAVIVWIAILEFSCIISYDKTYGCLNLGQFGYPRPYIHHLLFFLGALSYLIIGVLYLINNCILIKYMFKTITFILFLNLIFEAVTLSFFIGELEYFLIENLLLFLSGLLCVIWLFRIFIKSSKAFYYKAGNIFC